MACRPCFLLRQPQNLKQPQQPGGPLAHTVSSASSGGGGSSGRWRVTPSSTAASPTGSVPATDGTATATAATCMPLSVSPSLRTPVSARVGGDGGGGTATGGGPSLEENPVLTPWSPTAPLAVWGGGAGAGSSSTTTTATLSSLRTPGYPLGQPSGVFSPSRRLTPQEAMMGLAHFHSPHSPSTATTSASCQNSPQGYGDAIHTPSMSYREALSLLKNRKSDVNPNIGFVLSLRELAGGVDFDLSSVSFA